MQNTGMCTVAAAAVVHLLGKESGGDPTAAAAAAVCALPAAESTYLRRSVKQADRS